METGLERVARKAMQEPQLKFSSLLHHVTIDLLKESLSAITGGSAFGVDRESVEESKATFGQWSGDLLQAAHRGGYHPPPVRRVYIPKPGKTELRPIGIPTVRDRAFQRSVSIVLSAIYENDFARFSFGGRPGRSAHQALAGLGEVLANRKVSWVYEADLKNFFGSLNHDWLVKFMGHRIADPRVLTLINRWLKAGVIEGTEREESTKGTPQGGSISVLLSNVYLHYVLDLWFDKIVRPRLRGESYLVRYLDDFVVCFQFQSDALMFERVVKGRLAKFSLELEPSKTRLVPFGKFAKRDAGELGLRTPPTLAFLGFDLYGFRYSWGWFGTGFKPQGARVRKFLEALKLTMRACRHLTLKEQCAYINRKWVGWRNYFALPLNAKRLACVRLIIVRYWRKVLSSRSQRGRVTWAKFNKILKVYPIAPPHVSYTLAEWRQLANEQARI